MQAVCCYYAINHHISEGEAVVKNTPEPAKCCFEAVKPEGNV